MRIVWRADKIGKNELKDHSSSSEEEEEEEEKKKKKKKKKTAIKEQFGRETNKKKRHLLAQFGNFRSPIKFEQMNEWKKPCLKGGGILVEIQNGGGGRQRTKFIQRDMTKHNRIALNIYAN